MRSGSFVTAGGFDGDHLCLRPQHRQGRSPRRELLCKGLDAFRVVGETPGAVIAPEGQIQVELRNIDSCEDLGRSGHGGTSWGIVRMPALVKYGLQRPINCSGYLWKGHGDPGSSTVFETSGPSICRVLFHHTSGPRFSTKYA